MSSQPSSKRSSSSEGLGLELERPIKRMDIEDVTPSKPKARWSLDSMGVAMMAMSKKNKGKGKAKDPLGIPEIIWQKIFEFYYDNLMTGKVFFIDELGSDG